MNPEVVLRTPGLLQFTSTSKRVQKYQGNHIFSSDGCEVRRCALGHLVSKNLIWSSNYRRSQLSIAEIQKQPFRHLHDNFSECFWGFFLSLVSLVQRDCKCQAEGSTGTELRYLALLSLLKTVG